MHPTPAAIACLCMIPFIALGQGEIEKLPSSINSDLYDESSPVLSRDGKDLFFTRTADPDFESTLIQSDGITTEGVKDEAFLQQLSLIYSQIAGTPVPDPVASFLNQDIWISSVGEDSVSAPRHPGYPLNNALPNSLVSTGMSASEYILLNQFYDDGSMYTGFSRVTINERAETVFPKPMHIYGFDLAGADVNMTMTPNGHVVVLSMEGPDSEGQKDLYVSFFMRDNVWSTPVHMGDILNSEEVETSPYISPDKKYLYFSSDRPGGLGGHDIYMAERLDYTWLKWGEPVRLSDDVNSPYDDSNPYFDPDRRFFYFASRRDGSSDLFRQRLTPKPQLKNPIVIQGRIVNSETGQVVRGEVFWGQQSSKAYLEYFNSYNGEFEVVLTEYEAYKFQLRKPNHTAQRVLVDPRGIEKQGKDTMSLTFYLAPKQSSEQPAVHTAQHEGSSMQEVKVDNMISSFYDIFFMRSKAIMLRKSANALDELLQQLSINPQMEIMIIGHTDNVGDEDALQVLSYQRAETIKAYLVTHGIETQRIRITGMGASRPRYSNASESSREKNRRVEIKVLNP